MRIELSVIEKIEQYLMGTLSTQDKSDFEHQIQQDTILKEQVDFQQQLLRGIQNLALKKSASVAYASYKFRRLMIALGFVVLLVSTILLSLYFVPKSSESGADVNEPLPIEGSSDAVESGDISADVTKTNGPAEDESESVISVHTAQKKEAESTDTCVEAVVTNESTEQIEKRNVVATNEQVNTPVPGLASLSGPEVLHEWVITQNTSRSELKKIGEEIQAADGGFKAKEIRYKGELLVHISFTVSNASGEVNYSSPELGENGKVCIRFMNPGISAGWCGDEMNYRYEFDSTGDEESINAGSVMDNGLIEIRCQSVLSGKTNPDKPKRKRFFKQKEKFFSGQKRNNTNKRKRFNS